MSLVHASLFIALSWPFGHKHHPIPPAVVPVPPVAAIVIRPHIALGDPIVPESLCEHDPLYGWFLYGPDGTVGISTESCQGAFENWKKQPSFPWINNRS